MDTSSCTARLDSQYNYLPWRNPYHLPRTNVNGKSCFSALSCWPPTLGPIQRDVILAYVKINRFKMNKLYNQAFCLLSYMKKTFDAIDSLIYSDSWMALSMASAKVALGSSSPAGSPGPSLIRITLMDPSTTYRAWRLHLPNRPFPSGPSWVSSMSRALVNLLAGSARKVMFDSPILWSFAHASMTAASLTQ